MNTQEGLEQAFVQLREGTFLKGKSEIASDPSTCITDASIEKMAMRNPSSRVD